MCSKKRMSGSTVACSAQIAELRDRLAAADAVVAGAGAGMSASAGLTYSGERFTAYFADFITRYHLTDMYSAGFYPFPTPEEYWAYWSRQIYWNRYDQPARQPYLDLLTLLRDKEHFVITTNVDHQFQLAGADRTRLFYMQGDYGLWQCAKPCHAKTYDNEATVRRMVAQQQNMRIPAELLPRCPVCGGPMTMNLRVDDTFVEDAGWHAAAARYAAFLRRTAAARGAVSRTRGGRQHAGDYPISVPADDSCESRGVLCEHKPVPVRLPAGSRWPVAVHSGGYR